MNITRRTFIEASVATLLAKTSLGAQLPGGTKGKPNVLFILTDQQSLWTLSQYGGSLPGTPNIDSIGKRGATFRNFFVTSAVCTPSRGCYMTGRFPHAHGAYHNELPLHSDEFTLGHMFQNAGYETGYAGKWHLDGKNDTTWPDWIPEARSFGFEDHRWMYNQGHWKRIVERPAAWPGNHSVASYGEKRFESSAPDGRPDESYDVTRPGEYFTNWLTDKGIEFIERPREKPFFYVLSYPDPHQPYSVAEPYASMFPPAEMKLPQTFHQKNLPAWAEEMLEKEDLPSEGVTSADDPRREEIFRKRKAQYLGEVKCIDDSVGRILKTLEEKKLLENTLIIFASDHGEYMGEHGIYYKNALYEPAHHVGMLMCWPGHIAPGTQVNQCVANVDLLPTLAGLLGLKTAGREQGRDASALLRSETGQWEDVAFIHKDNFTQSGLFTEQWELGLAQDGDSVLFDRKNDPNQVHNLFHEKTHAPIVKELTNRTIRHNREIKCPALAWLEK